MSGPILPQQPYRPWSAPATPLYKPYPPTGAFTAANWANKPNMPSQFAAPARKPTDASLQQQFPGHYARLTASHPVSDNMRTLRENWETVNQVAHNQPVKDHRLAGLNDNMKMGGSMMIAALATLGLKQWVLGIGEFLGFASWFGAMAATPKIINGMVQWKTGVNLNQMYDSTYGQRLNLFTDPHYLPLHILPDAIINRAADKLGIPRGPERRQQTEEKMRQISVQSHTWWMLVAGPATPVISGLACDALQNPMMRLVNRIKAFGSRGLANLAIENPNKNYKLTKAQVAQRTRAYLDQLLGELPESQLSGWWKAFGKGIIRETKLGLNISIKDITKAGRDEQIEKLIDFFKNNPQPDSVFAYLNAHYKPATATSGASGQLEDLRKTATDYLQRALKDAKGQERLSKEAFEELQQLIDTRILNAESTVNHYRHLLAAVRNGADRAELKTLMCDANINAVQGFLNEGHFALAEKLVGDAHIFQKISAALSNEARQFDKAFKLMGASPEKHLLDEALKHMKLGNLWRRRMGLYLGGGTLLATGIYSYFFVGKDFNSTRNNTEGMRL